MQKTLSVSVAAYNVGKYLRKALESCTIPSIMDELEVLVINDGSSDDTSTIAHEYETKYPQTFRVIDKENGGYGSTVNTSMQMATGKYFKLLDGDDWFDKQGLEQLVTHLRNCEADLVLSGRLEVNDNNECKHTLQKWETQYAKKYNGQLLNLENLQPFIYGMWFVTYRTAIMREHPFSLPEKMLYTDRLYVTYPIPWIKTISFLDYDVYCYRVGNADQSVSPTNRIRHKKEYVEGFRMIMDYYSGTKDLPEHNNAFLKLRICKFYIYTIKTILLLPPSHDSMKEIINLDEEIKGKSPELYKYIGDNYRFIRMCRRYSFRLYWPFRLLRKQESWL